jgi:hypothetical protein
MGNADPSSTAEIKVMVLEICKVALPPVVVIVVIQS